MDSDNVASVSQSVGSSAYPLVIDWKKRKQKIHVMAPTIEAVTKIENEIALRLLNAPDAVQHLITLEQYQREKSAARTSIAANKHRFNGETYNEIMRGQEAAILQLWANVREPLSLDDVRELIADEAEHVMSAYMVLVPDFLSLVAIRYQNANPETVRQALLKGKQELQEKLAARAAASGFIPSSSDTSSSFTSPTAGQ
jgi:hypothetical protein